MSEFLSADQVEAWVEEGREAFLADFRRIVETPSVSSDPDRKGDIQACAELAAELLREAGATQVEVYQTKGNPVVFGRLEQDPSYPTVAIYNHLDVQPATAGQDGWTRDPWTFTEDGGRFYSRGTTDDKGPALTCLWAARLAKENGVKVNVEFLWELEEEIGSPNFPEFVKHAKEQGWIKASQVVVSDTIWISPERPAITRSLRGLMAAEVVVRTAQKDAHSGMAGGPARNPLTDLCALVASCVDAGTGDILVEGFDETWTPPTEAELEDFRKAGFSVENFQSAHQLDKLRHDDPVEVASRIWAKPTFEVHGIVGGYQGEGTKTVVPATARLKISCRLVPGQEPGRCYELFEKHVKKRLPDAEVIRDHAAMPYKVPDEDLDKVSLIQDAMEYSFGSRPVMVAEGGSIGAVLTMREELGVPVLFLPLSLPQDSYHGPDESFAWSMVPGGVKAFLRFFELVGSAGE